MASKSLTLTTCLGENTDPICTAVADYLASRLGLPLKFEGTLPWSERQKRLKSGDIDLGWICGLLYVQMVVNSPLRLLAAAVLQGEAYNHEPIYFSKVLVRRETPYQHFADLRGSRVVINEPGSFSGCYLLRYHLAQWGEYDKFFGQVFESGSHRQSIEWVLNDRADAAAIDCTVYHFLFNRQPDWFKQLRVLTILGPSPMPPFVFSPRVSQERQQHIRHLLIGMADTADGRRLLDSLRIERFVPVGDADYDAIRRAAVVGERARL